MFLKSLMKFAGINGLIKFYFGSPIDASFYVYYLLSICPWMNEKQSQF